MTLFEAERGATSITEYLDTGLAGGQFYYYSLFVLPSAGGSSWVLVGQDAALVAADYGYTEELWELVPSHLRQMDAERGSPLERFLSMISTGFDHIRAEQESMRNLHDVDKVSAGLLPVLGAELGIDVQPILGDIPNRRYLRNAVYLHKRRGTIGGIAALGSTITGWQTVVTFDPGMLTITLRLLADRINLVHNPSFEVDLTGWVAGSASVLERVNDWATRGAWSAKISRAARELFAGATEGTPGTAVPISGSEPNVWVIQSALATGRFFSDEQVYEGTTSLKATSTGASPVWGRRIPVAEGTSYTTVARVFSATAARSYRMSIVWRDASANVVGTTVNGTGKTTVLNAWTILNSLTATAPAGAVTGDFRVGSTNSVSGDVFYVDDVSVLGVPPQGEAAGMFTPAGAAAHSLAVERGDPGQYQFSVDVELTSGTAPVTLTLNWYAADGSAVGTPTTYPAVDVVAGSDTRLNVSGTSPQGSARFSAEISAVLAGSQQLRVDGVLIEPAHYVQDYFDGDGAPIEDYLWQGTPHASPSHLYYRREVKTQRLAALLTDYVSPELSTALAFSQSES